MPVSKAAQDQIAQSLDSVTGNPESGIHGLVFVAVDKEVPFAPITSEFLLTRSKGQNTRLPCLRKARTI